MTDAWLAQSVVTVAYGWRLERKDGVTLGFTSHDKNIVIDGLLLRASPGLIPASITQSSGLVTSGVDINGILSSDAIRADDLEMGRWNGASLSVFLFDWTQPSAGTRLLAAGELGAIRLRGFEFETELLGPAARLDRPIVPFTSPTCRARFCDGQCQLNQARYEYRRAIAGVTDDILYFSDMLPGLTNGFARGVLRRISGKACGTRHDILASGADWIRLVFPVVEPFASGDKVILVEGCDRRLETCATRFNNSLNFRGEPHLPGNDLLTRYPGAG